MSAKLNVPVGSQMSVPVLNGLCNGKCSNGRTSGNLSGKRRIFVETETGCVLGVDMEKGDNVYNIKRRLQLAFNVPTDESTLTFGDVLLNNDLSSVRNDSPLLLTRNVIHRSSSNPCPTPRGNNHHQSDESNTIEILRGDRAVIIDELVKDIVKAIKNGVDPVPVKSGLGGTYYFRNSKGENIAIVKPTDEEPFAPNNPKGFVGKSLGQSSLKRSVRVGETGFREVAAYLLDHDHVANVPPTVLVKVTHSVFNVNGGVNEKELQETKMVSKIASLQQYIPHDFEASDYGTSSFPVSAVHRIGILDIRIFNTDRHAGNLLVRKVDGVGRFGQVELTPIDHGLCLPERLEDPYFEWIHWPQASIPFSEEELEYIKNLDPVRESKMLQMELPMIRKACLRLLELCTVFLKEATAFGLCLAEIGEMMSREYKGQEDKPSELEVVCLEARRNIARWEISTIEAEGNEELIFDMACEDDRVEMDQDSYHFGCEGASTGRFLLSELDENLEEDEAYEDAGPAKEERISDWPNWNTNASKLSMSLKNSNLGNGNLKRQGEKCILPEFRRSVNEKLLSTTATYVKLADMRKEEWSLFLEKFKELLYPAFANRRSATFRQRQIQRLGTSCQF
ncbi:hypothetical protein FNV43_RR20762 [Rhamnella rubrinervis]|uniref:1-phosphatidylinositol 4-kinase n=1 Tax=Rhamnella rubrinervis TaxID=2594499 RepID=A0A8K0DWJ5_9ROSA|nr:hypothetical protein FNV43_RR20762 [Rhamnella rubrinervis]